MQSATTTFLKIYFCSSRVIDIHKRYSHSNPCRYVIFVDLINVMVLKRKSWSWVILGTQYNLMTLKSKELYPAQTRVM